MRPMAILICSEPVYPTGWAAQPSENISRHFFQRQRNPLRIQHGVKFDEHEKINIKNSALIFSYSNYILQCDALVNKRFGPLYLASAVRRLS